MRLQTFLAHAGVSSRRSAEAVLAEGKVSVNGRTVRERGFAVDPERDEITLDGKRLATERLEYYLVHKPRGVISTVSDPHAPWIVTDLLPKGVGRLYPVGRLDKDTTGVIILTNDGALAFSLTHPRFGIPKIYRVVATGKVSDEALANLQKGVELDDGMTAPCVIKMLSRDTKKSVCDITLREGKKRQVRRMFDAVGFPLTGLTRISIGPVKLGDLKEGEYRCLSASEVRSLKELALSAGDRKATKEGTADAA